MKQTISILFLFIFAFSKEALDICNRDIISLAEAKKCKDDEYLNDYIKYLKMPIKDLIKTSKKNYMFKEYNKHELIYNYKNFNEFVKNRAELNRYRKYLNCNSKGDLFHIVYKGNRAILTCGNGNGFSFNILIINKRKAELIPLYSECGMFMPIPKPIAAPQNSKNNNKITK